MHEDKALGVDCEDEVQDLLSNVEFPAIEPHLDWVGMEWLYTVFSDTQQPPEKIAPDCGGKEGAHCFMLVSLFTFGYPLLCCLKRGRFSFRIGGYHTAFPPWVQAAIR